MNADSTLMEKANTLTQLPPPPPIPVLLSPRVLNREVNQEHFVARCYRYLAVVSRVLLWILTMAILFHATFPTCSTRPSSASLLRNSSKTAVSSLFRPLFFAVLGLFLPTDGRDGC